MNLIFVIGACALAAVVQVYGQDAILQKLLFPTNLQVSPPVASNANAPSNSEMQKLVDRQQLTKDNTIPTGGPPQSSDAGRPFSDKPVNSHLLGGTRAATGQWPWQAFLVNVPEPSSASAANFVSVGFGGSVISGQWILTSAYFLHKSIGCLVYLGGQNFDPSEIGVVGTNTKYIFIHKSFNPVTLANNIALVKLEMNLVFPSTGPSFIRAIRLPGKLDASSTFINTNAVLLGWSYVNAEPKDLTNFTAGVNSVTRPIVNNSECALAYGSKKLEVSSATTMCISGYKSGRTAFCQGDLGSSMVYKAKDNSYTLLGVASFGMDVYGNGSFPLVYTRVTSYLSWIGTITGIQIV